jgi:hypothetical protein
MMTDSKRSLTDTPLKQLMAESAEMHRRYHDVENIQQARFQVAAVAQALTNRYLYKKERTQ